jgi:hypothetical protein
VKELTLNWGIGNGFSGAGTCPATAGQFPPSGNWNCNFPVLRVDLVMAVNAGGSSVLSRTARSGITDTMFFMPTTTGTSSTDTAIFSPPGGSIYAANCSSSTCTGNINNLGSTAYYMRVTALYVKNAPLVITNSSSQPFLNAQAIIDATGQAQDVLRRVVVAVDLTDANAYTIPSGALITENSVCKQFGVAPITEPYWPSGYFSSTNLTGGGNNNELCTTLNTP